MTDKKDSAFVDNDQAYNKTIHAVPLPEKEIGIDTKNYIFQNIINAGTASVLNTGEIESFTNVSHNREQVYQLLDAMGEDSKISAVLETYAEDATEYNDKGQIVWVESADPNIAAYVEFLLNSLCVDKHIYNWMYCLCKYGDVYFRLYRESEYTDLLFAPKKTEEEKAKEALNESIKIKAYAKNDKYVHYVEMVPNPAEVFELTRFGKTSGYIKTSINSQTNLYSQNELNQVSQYWRYKFKQRDVQLFAATEFVHACLDDNSTRTPEEVEIFIDNTDHSNINDTGDGENKSMSYSVRRGQSVLYNSYKVWRELQLLESSVLLSRVTQSSISRIIQVEVGDMPKEMVGPHLQGIKQMVEQKSALNVGSGMSEYTNPGPIINNIYVPTHGGIGAISASTLGEQYNPGELVDLNYYMNNLYGSLRVPKQYFNQTDDATGFNGGTSLSIISSRYAKAIKRLQNTMVQALTDIVNLMLIDNDLSNYINRFQIRMLAPTTQEEKDRRESTSTRLQLVRDVMDMTSDIDDVPTKLQMVKDMLTPIVNNQEVIELIQSHIDKVKREQEAANNEEAHIEEDSSGDADFGGGEGSADFDMNEPMNFEGGDVPSSGDDAGGDVPSTESSDLPSASDLGVDLTSNEQ